MSKSRTEWRISELQHLESRTLLSGSSLNLADLNGSNGVRFDGIDQTEPSGSSGGVFGDRSGRSISIVGDVNGDGFDDVLIGALGGDGPTNTTGGAGEAYLVFGKGNWSASSTFSLSSLNGTNGVLIYGLNSGDGLGGHVSPAGDVNGDGFDDFLISSSSGDGPGNNGPTNSGETYLIFGKSNWSASPTLDLSSLNGTTGVVFYGIDASDFSGSPIGRAGDVNNDGFDDFLIGASRGDGAANSGDTVGETYLIFGKSNWSATPSLSLSTLDGTSGVTFYGIDNNDNSGGSISAAGDVNNDGFDDFLIGATGGDGAAGTKSNSGEVYLIFGKANWSSTSSVNLSSLNGTTGVTFYGVDNGDDAGISVSSAGDFNGDGFADILISGHDSSGAGNFSPGSGEAYVIFGKANWSSTPILNLADLNGKNGVTFYGTSPGGRAGFSVSTAGDFNGDGYSDIVIGAYLADGRTSSSSQVVQAGQIYLIYGKSDWTYTPALWMSALNGSNGQIIYGTTMVENAGFDVRSGGDVNDDGFDDLLIGAPQGNRNPNAGSDSASAGAAYLIFGGSSPTIDRVGVHRGDSFYQDVNNSFSSNTGDRVVGFGNSTDIPLVGDWNNDGNDEVGIFRNGYWYLDLNANNTWDGISGGDIVFSFGNSTDTPLVGDWNADGTDDIGVKRGDAYYLDGNGNRAWNGSGGGDSLFSFGNIADIPIIGDWNGNGRDKIGIFREGIFYLDANGNGVWNDVSGGDSRFGFGMSGDKPLIGDWNGDGIDDVGIVRGNSWYLDQNGNRSWNGTIGGDVLFVYGNSSDTPLVGRWKSPASAPVPNSSVAVQAKGKADKNGSSQVSLPNQLLDTLFSQLAAPLKKMSR